MTTPKEQPQLNSVLWDLATGRAILPPEPTLNLAQLQQQMIQAKAIEDRNAEIIRQRDIGRRKMDAIEKAREKEREQTDKDRAGDIRAEWQADYIKAWTAAGHSLDSLTPKVLEEEYVSWARQRMQAAQARIAARYGEWI